MSDNHSRAMTRRTLMAAGIAAIIAFAAPVMAAPLKVAEKDVSVTTPDGTAQGVLFTPRKGKGPWPAILLWPDLGGMRPALRPWGRQLAAEGFVVLMPNAYYRSGPPSTDDINMADPEVRKRQMAYRATATDDGIVRDGTAYVAFLDAQKQTDRGRKMGTLGYDVGGGYAVRTAAALPDRIGAVSVIYGLGVATERPNSPHLLIPKSKAAYYVVQAKDDDAREPGDKEDIRKAIQEGGLQGNVEVDPANHGFATPGSKSADAASAARVQGEIVKFFSSTLK